MPKIISYTPSWLSRPSPGFQLFASSYGTLTSKRANGTGSEQNLSLNGNDYLGPKRTIARRGTEIFAVVDNEIRWSDLCMLKDDWEEQQKTVTSEVRTNGSGQGNEAQANEQNKLAESNYRVLKVPVSEKIRQITISPNGHFLAIVTSHTIHIAIVPDSSQLGQVSSAPIRAKTYTIGPTTHVLSQSQVASALWHPCGISGSCLVTVTANAVVRLWELDLKNHWSFDSPSFAIDLKKLLTGESQGDDFTPPRIGRNRAFSTDAIGMDVASASFGGTGSSEESAWSAMTLWIAMQEGDVYALCPLLPSKWQPSPTVLSSLSTAAVSRAASMTDGNPETPEETRQHAEQYDWISEIDGQVPILLPGNSEFSKEAEVYDRPDHPGPVPVLQGPFQIHSSGSEEDLDITDIHVIAAKIDADELMIGEDPDWTEDSDEEQGLSVSVICLMTRNGKVYMCLDLDGVEGRWLPRKKLCHASPSQNDPYLVVLEILETLHPEEVHDVEWPTFSCDISSRYSFFVTHSKGVFFFSLDTWLPSLENELQATGTAGLPFRIDIFRNGPGTLRERILRFEQTKLSDMINFPAACLILHDSDLGYLLLTVLGGQPQAVTLDSPDLQRFEELRSDGAYGYEPERSMLAIGPARSAYQPPAAFWEPTSLTTSLDKQVPSHHKRALKDEIRLSIATLDLMTEAHRILSQETHQLGLAAADLFRRCERLQFEFRDQIKRSNEIANQVENVTGEDADEYQGNIEKKGKTALAQRLEAANTRQMELVARYEETKKKSARFGGRELSDKDQMWASEVEKLRDSIGMPKIDEDHDHEHQAGDTWRRIEEVRELFNDLVPQAKEVAQGEVQTDLDGTSNIPPDLRKAKVMHVMSLLERESALVDAAQSRLERLSLASVS